jgi:hypothetical protein
MANAFSSGRVSIWHTSLKSFNPAYDAMAKLGGTDVFFDLDDPLLTTTVMGAAKEHVSADGKPWRAQSYKVWRTGGSGQQFALDLVVGITKLRPGVSELDIEGPNDQEIGNAVGGCLSMFRGGQTGWRLAFPLCFNFAPLKGYVLPIAQMAADPFCYVRVQRYYGAEQRPAEPTLCREDIVGRGFPADRFSFMESAKPRRLIDGTVFNDLPIFSDGGVRVRNLSGGAVYNANLLREAGLI